MAAVCLLRKIAGMVAKRSVGMRLGHHALDDLLADYEASLRDATRLAAVRTALQPLLGTTNSRFNLLEILGQPTAEKQPLVSLQGRLPAYYSYQRPCRLRLHRGMTCHASRSLTPTTASR